MSTGLSRIQTWVDERLVQRALAVLLPLVLLAFATGDALWLRAAIVTYACFLAVERAGLTPLGVVLHGAVILASFLALFFSLLVPPLFVLACALLAAATIGLATLGNSLRWIGISTLISTLYVACETAENSPSELFTARAIQILPYLVAAIVPVLVLSIVDHVRTARCDRRSFDLALFREDHFGDRALSGPAAIATALGAALATAAAAAIVEWYHLEHGQWTIWSTATVVVSGDATTAHLKLRDRSIGAIVGGAFGIGLGLMLPHTAIAYGLMTIAALLALVSFREFVIGFGTMCAFISGAIIVANQSPVIAAERSVNVILGGLMGVLFLLAAHLLVQWWTRCPPARE